MAANVSTTSGKVNFVSRIPAWWGIGRKLYDKNENVSIAKALKDAGLDGPIHALDPKVDWHGNTYYNEGSKSLYFEYEPEKITYLGDVTDDYSLIQNNEIAEILEPITEKFPLFTCGAIGKQYRLFLSFYGGEWEIGGRGYINYLSITDDKTAKQRTKGLISPVCILCENTEKMAIDAASFNVDIIHKKGNKERLQAVSASIVEMQKKQDQVISLFGEMAKTPYSVEEFTKLVTEKIYRISEKEEKELAEINKLFSSEPILPTTEKAGLAQGLFAKLNDEFPKIAGTQLAAYEAITELENHYISRGPNNPANVLFGNRAKTMESAFAEIVKAK